MTPIKSTSLLLPLACLLWLCCLPLAGCGSGGHQAIGGPSDYRNSINPAVWRKSVVYYRIHGGPAIGASLVRQYIKRGIHRWDKTFEGILTIQEATGRDTADIDIKFVAVGSLGGSFLGNQVLGRDQKPEKEPEEGKHWRSVPVIKNGVFESVVVNLDSQLLFRLPTLERITAHEFAHTLYMNESHSPYPEDLGHSPPNTSIPNSRDTRTARMVYGVSP